MKEIILKWVLKNAAEHDGKAQAGAIMNKVIGELPEARGDMKKLGKEIATVVKEVNAMKPEAQKQKLLAIWPSALDKKEEKPKEMPELPNAVPGKFKVRIAPNTNGPMHIGHTRGVVINDFYAKKYNGTFVIRIDDSSPEVKAPMPEAYDWHPEDVMWITGRKPEEIEMTCSSDKMPVFYEYAEKLIKLGGAYTCTCTQEESQKNRRAGEACPHRSQPTEKSLKEWKDILAGKYKPKDIVLKIKTSMNNPNPALRDWIAFRISLKPHPRQGTKYKVWAMMDFCNAIDDHLIGMTHIIRGKELIMSTDRQKYIYKYFGWKYPETFYWGRVKLCRNNEVMKISKSGFAKGIAEGKYTSWDDPRIPTVRGMRKAGIKPEALREFWLNMGLSERDISASWEGLEAINKKYA